MHLALQSASGDTRTLGNPKVRMPRKWKICFKKLEAAGVLRRLRAPVLSVVKRKGRKGSEGGISLVCGALATSASGHVVLKSDFRVV